MIQLKDRIAVVTGAASGMGRGIAIKLAESGAIIELLDRQDCDASLDAIREVGGTAYAHKVDVTDEAGLSQVANAILEKHGRLDILVNNAGVLSGGKAWNEHTREDLERFIGVNYIGYFLVIKALHPLLLKSTSGRIINVASRTYFLGNPGQLAYVASKGAVIGMTRVLARELGRENITVNAVAPGMIATPGVLEHFPEEAADAVMQNQAIKKRGQPRHLAGLIAFLASEDADMITGQTLLADGGGYML
jgi:3-oxoacyl-[acyl-carrier protein] reductase